jgi:hypothetical protein
MPIRKAAVQNQPMARGGDEDTKLLLSDKAQAIGSGEVPSFAKEAKDGPPAFQVR